MQTKTDALKNYVPGDASPFSADPPTTATDKPVQLALHGGAPVRTDPWPTYDKGDVFINPQDEEAALRAIRSHLYFRYDYRTYEETQTGRLEQRLADYFGVRYALAVSSGTAALALALMGAGVPRDSLVTCPGFSFAATPSAIIMAGCKPVLAEVDENLHLDIEDLRRRWNPYIKAIMVVHMRGFASDMAALLDFAAQVGVPVIEDAVPSLGVDLNGRKLGTYGLAGGFSTQSDKSLNTGEGGFLLTNDETLYARAVVLSGAYENRYRRHFRDGRAPIATDLELPLMNFRMDEIRAALALSEMDYLNDRLQRFKRNYEYVLEKLCHTPGIRIRQPVAPGSYLGESLIFRVTRRDPRLFADALCREGIDARNLGAEDDTNIRCFWNWRFMYDTSNVKKIKGMLPHTTRYLEQAVDIPLSSTLSRRDCDHLVMAVLKVAQGLAASPVNKAN